MIAEEGKEWAGTYMKKSYIRKQTRENIVTYSNMFTVGV